MLILFRNLGWLIGLISRQQWMLVSSHHQRHARYYSVAAVQDIRGSTTGRLPALQTPAGVLDENVTPLSSQPPPHAVLPQDMQVQSGSSRAWGSP